MRSAKDKPFASSSPSPSLHCDAKCDGTDHSLHKKGTNKKSAFLLFQHFNLRVLL